MKNLKGMISVIIMLTIVFSANACAKNEPVSSTGIKKMVIQVGSTQTTGETDSYYTLISEISKRIEEWTDGSVKLEYFGESVLGSDSEMVEALKGGTLDAGIITAATVTSSVPSMGLLDLPYLFKDDETAFDFIDNSPVAKKLEEDISDVVGAKVVGWCHNGFRNVLNNKKQIKNIEDFKGLKIRVMESPTYFKLFTLLGASPTPMSYNECMTGLEQGTVDGLDQPIMSSHSQGNYKMVKYFDLTKHTCTEGIFVIRNKVFESMSPELQDLFYKAANEAQAVQRSKLMEFEENALKDIQSYGTNVGRDVNIEGIQKKAVEMYSDYRDSIGSELFDEAMEYLGIKLD